MSIYPRSVEFHQCHAKPHSICFFFFFFYQIIKDNERNLCQDLLTIENTDSDLKVHALHYANELLVRVRLSFQKLLQNRSTYRNNTNVWEKSRQDKTRPLYLTRVAQSAAKLVSLGRRVLVVDKPR